MRCGAQEVPLDAQAALEREKRVFRPNNITNIRGPVLIVKLALGAKKVT